LITASAWDFNHNPSMKPTDICLAAASALPVILALFGGYHKGYVDGSKPNAIPAAATSGRAELPYRQGTPRTTGSSDDAKKTAALLSRWLASPDAGIDFELHAEMDRLLDELSSESIAAFLSGPPVPPANLRQAILLAWAEKDGPAAMAVAIDDDRAAVSAFRNWTVRDSDAAIAWLAETHFTSPSRDKLLINAMLALRLTNPVKAFEILAAQYPEKRNQYLSLVITDSKSDDATKERLLALAAGKGTPEELERARAMQFSFLVKDDPAAAAEWAAANAGSAEELAQMEAKLLRTAETSKRFAALEGWLERHVTVEVLPEDVTQAFRYWFASHHGQLVHWLKDLPDGPHRDALLATGIAGSFGRLPQAAELAGEVRSPQLRESALRRIDQLWHLTKPEEAAAWRESLSEEDRTLLAR